MYAILVIMMALGYSKLSCLISLETFFYLFFQFILIIYMKQKHAINDTTFGRRGIYKNKINKN